MRVWFFANSARFAAERRAVEALAANEGWLRIQRWALVEFRMAVECVITAGGDYPVRLVFPDQYPEVPAWVEPQDSKAKWSHHQYGPGGALCLELRPDNWDAAANGADVLRSAYHLLKKENPLGGGGAERSEVPSAHSIGDVQAYGWTQPVMIGAGLAGRLRDGAASNVCALQWKFVDDKFRTLVVDDTDRESSRRPPPAGDSISELPVFYVNTEAPCEPPTSRAELVTSFHEEDREQVMTFQHGLLLFVGAKGLAAYHLINSEAFRRKVVVLASDSGTRSARDAVAAAKRVAIVGVGSVGSKIAESLVRSGVTKLRLVDGDVMLPGNLERHVLDWRDIGVLKADAVRRRALLIVPGADIESVDDNLNWQRSARTHARQVDLISDCDVVVDATGDVPTSLFLGAIAAANNRPFFSTVVFEGGLGTLVAACIPGRDPAYSAARAAFVAWCGEQSAEVPQSTGRRYEALGEDGVPIAADDASVTIAAGHTSRAILDCLDERVPGRESAWLLIGFRRGWVFNGHGHLIHLSVGEPSEGGTAPRDEEALEFGIRLTKEALDAFASRE